MEVSEETKRGIYSKASPWVDDHWMSKIDIEQMNLILMNTTQYGYTYRPLQKRVMIDFTKEACVSGREAKLQNYSEWNYNNYFKIVDQQWFEKKHLDKYTSKMSLHNLFLLWTHFAPLLGSGQVSTAYGAVIPNLRYPVFVSRPALSEGQ